jgi:hypothetical protein
MPDIGLQPITRIAFIENLRVSALVALADGPLSGSGFRKLNV